VSPIKGLKHRYVDAKVFSSLSLKRSAQPLETGKNWGWKGRREERTRDRRLSLSFDDDKGLTLAKREEDTVCCMLLHVNSNCVFEVKQDHRFK